MVIRGLFTIVKKDNKSKWFVYVDIIQELWFFKLDIFCDFLGDILHI